MWVVKQTVHYKIAEEQREFLRGTTALYTVGIFEFDTLLVFFISEMSSLSMTLNYIKDFFF